MNLNCRFFYEVSYFIRKFRYKTIRLQFSSKKDYMLYEKSVTRQYIGFDEEKFQLGPKQRLNFRNKNEVYNISQSFLRNNCCSQKLFKN